MEENKPIENLVQIDQDSNIANDARFGMDEVYFAIEATIRSRPQIECKPIHTFTKGMYSRELIMPADMDIISKVHNTEHQYIVLSGEVEVFTPETGWVTLRGGDRGVTQPGTQRILRTIKETRWITFHPTNHTPVDNTDEALEEAALKVEHDIILVKINPLLENKHLKEIPLSGEQLIEIK